jgi:hypothetical protein
MAAYTDDQRKAARTLYEQRGSRVAAQQLGIPPRTIREWARQGDWAKRLAAASGEAADAAAGMRAGWALRRQGLADDAAEAAHLTVQLYMRRVRAGTIYGLQELARSFALFTERAAEMSAGLGGQEPGGEIPPEQAVAGLNRVLDAIEPRVAGDG